MAIMKDVAQHGDQAVLDYTAKFDGVRPGSLLVSKQEIRQAYSQVTKEQVKAVKLMKQKLLKSELAVFRRLKGIAVSSEGVKIDKVVRPVASVGCYIPGGKARDPSTVVMCAGPAKG